MKLLLEELLGGFALPRFMEEHWQKRPFVSRSTASPHAALTFDAFHALLAGGAGELIAARDGGAHPEGSRRESARELFAAGYSLVLRQPESSSPELATFGRTLARELHAALNFHLYATPAGHGSFGWHCDPEDVFIFQCAGVKRYDVRENTTAPWPTHDFMGGVAALAQETSPVESVTLNPGDWLYIPAGHWHDAQAESDALSISVGLLAPSGLDVLDHLRARLVQSERWRRRLRCAGPASGTDGLQVMKAYRSELAALGQELLTELDSDRGASQFLSAFLRSGLRSR